MDFAPIVDALFADPDYAEPVIVTYPGGLAVPAMAIVTEEEPVSAFFEVRARTPGLRIDLRTADFATRPPEDTRIVRADSSEARVRITLLDQESLVWELTCDPVRVIAVPSEGLGPAMLPIAAGVWD
jgi:hypothetical protein